MIGPRRSAKAETPLSVIKRRKWLALVIIVSVMTVVVSVVLALPDIYQATATVQVERQQVPESFFQSTVTSGVDSRLRTITRQILSPDRLEELIHRFDLYPEIRGQMPLTRVIARMEQDIRLEQQQESRRRRGRWSGITTAFTLSFRSSEPQKVAHVTNILADFYIKENVKVREQQATGTAQFVQKQLETIRHKLEAQELKLSQFKEQYIGELPEQLSANLATLERLNSQLRLVNDKLARTSERRSVLTQQLAVTRQATNTIPAASDSSLPRLTRLQQELQSLQSRFSDRYPTIIQLKAEIAILERQLTGATTTPEPQTAPLSPQAILFQEELQAVNLETRTLKLEEQRLLDSIALYQRRVENTPRREQEMQTLMRDHDTTQALYHSLLKRQEEAKLAESMEQSQQGEQFRLLEPASTPTAPAAPNRMRLLLIGAFVALGLAAGAVLVTERLDTSFHVVDDLRVYSHLPVIQSLPRIDTKKDRRRRRWRFALASIIAVCVFGFLANLLHTAASDNFQLARLLSL